MRNLLGISTIIAIVALLTAASCQETETLTLEEKQDLAMVLLDLTEDGYQTDVDGATVTNDRKNHCIYFDYTNGSRDTIRPDYSIRNKDVERLLRMVAHGGTMEILDEKVTADSINRCLYYEYGNGTKDTICVIE